MASERMYKKKKRVSRGICRDLTYNYAKLKRANAMNARNAKNVSEKWPAERWCAAAIEDGDGGDEEGRKEW